MTGVAVAAGGRSASSTVLRPGTPAGGGTTGEEFS